MGYWNDDGSYGSDFGEARRTWLEFEIDLTASPAGLGDWEQIEVDLARKNGGWVSMKKSSRTGPGRGPLAWSHQPRCNLTTLPWTGRWRQVEKYYGVRVLKEGPDWRVSPLEEFALRIRQRWPSGHVTGWRNQWEVRAYGPNGDKLVYERQGETKEDVLRVLDFVKWP